MRSLLAICLLAAACEAPVTAVDGPDDSFLGGGSSGGKADTGGVVEGSPDALAVLALVNSADVATLHDGAGLDARAASNIVAYRLDDEQFDTLKELDAVPYVGPAAFAKLLAYAKAHPPATPPTPSGWTSSLPSGPFAIDVQVTFPATESFCQPTCIVKNQSESILLHLSRDTGGTIALGFTNLADQDYLALPVPAVGTFSRSEPVANVNGSGGVAFDGHFEPGRVVVIDDYGYDYTYDHGFATGWYTTIQSTAAGKATF